MRVSVSFIYVGLATVSALKMNQVQTWDQSIDSTSEKELCHNLFYMYDLPRNFDDETNAKTVAYANMDKTMPFDHFYSSDLSFVGAVIHRVYKSNCRTTDPNKAHAFLIPLWSKRKNSASWTSKCHKYSASEFEKSLTNLNSQNAKQHIFMHNHGNWKQGCSGWWSKPSVQLEGVSRFTVEDRGITTLKSTIPYSSQVHYTKGAGEVPWAKDFPRPNLAVFIGSLRQFHHNPSSATDREGIIQSCEANPNLCAMHASNERVFKARDYFTIYSSGEFCMQPPGDSMVRKGMVDSLLVGCIPVLFEPEQIGVWPWHWNGWRNMSMVYIHKNAHSDPISVLKGIPLEKRKQMRETIARNAHKMQYALDEPPLSTPDAWNILVDHVKNGETEFHAKQDEARLTSQFNMMLMQLEKREKPELAKGTTYVHIPDDGNMPIVVGM
eukprot:gnl/MRDRNA2_/MRDRNA2_84012_c0_seq3.p1 gnl/MRDRNA2_/MRDRNA2_84012_c0~~gnl/MRDRNA2_/MRDRNA2_84012_c0_seq3.p1  ORF type:complete len:438 (+),score=42.54 gnl/MRDRNA2_/MRDRNA2_84012_c0_seq3:67-1380(+)